DAAPAAATSPAEAQSSVAPAPGSEAATPPASATALLPRDLSPWGMFLSADVVVKAEMIALVHHSFAPAPSSIAPRLEIASARRRRRREHSALSRTPSLAEAGGKFDTRASLAPLLRAALIELRLSADASDKEGTKERVASRLERIEAAVGRRMTRGTGI